MFTIELLKNHPDLIPQLANMWYELLGQLWVPDISIERAETRFREHLNDKLLPLTLIAMENNRPIGMCSLRENDGIRPELKPWLGSLVVDKSYQKQGVAQLLMDAIKENAKTKGFDKLYLFTFDPTLPIYYQRCGWEKIGTDVFKSHPVTVMDIVL